MNKKAIELTMSTIIVAVLVLIVLAVLSYILLTQSTLFRSSLKCESRGGDCQPSPCTEQKPIQAFKGCYVDKTYYKDYYCCIALGQQP